MTDFNVSVGSKNGEIVVYEGENTIIVKQRHKGEDQKIIIDSDDWNTFVHAILIADDKRRKVTKE